ncbi:MAG: 2-oxoacid:acceptor oxidoreductase family protein [Dehalococcoidia bacterium]|nr:2-oxoacid:acceptor oxidoreductase family protein [Dehalococcoidia bacterium]
MLIKTMFTGFGGQGVLSMGLNLAEAAMEEGKYVTYLPAYGLEVRGGTAHCTVAISDEEIASPVASSPDFLVVMNQPSLDRYQNHVHSGGVLFINSSITRTTVTRGDIDIVEVPANAMAEELKSPKSANMIMLGSFCKKSNLVSVNSLFHVLEDTLKSKKSLIEINKKALMAGYNL